MNATLFLALALAFTLALDALLTVAFFRLRRRHRHCRHALNDARRKRDKLAYDLLRARLDVASLQRRALVHGGERAA